MYAQKKYIPNQFSVCVYALMNCDERTPDFTRFYPMYNISSKIIIYEYENELFLITN